MFSFFQSVNLKKKPSVYSEYEYKTRHRYRTRRQTMFESESQLRIEGNRSSARFQQDMVRESINSRTVDPR